MRVFFAVVLAFAVAACGGRQVEVKTGATPAAAAAGTVRVTNNLTQPVNVSVVSAGTELFLRQVAPNATETLTVSGVAPASTVTLRATTADGTRTYTRDNVSLAQQYFWQVP